MRDGTDAKFLASGSAGGISKPLAFPVYVFCYLLSFIHSGLIPCFKLDFGQIIVRQVLMVQVKHPLGICVFSSCSHFLTRYRQELLANIGV